MLDYGERKRETSLFRLIYKQYGVGVEAVVTFGAWVRQQREVKGLGPAVCARRAGMSPQRWSNLEAKSKRPYRETCEAVARGLGMSLEEVMTAAGLTIGSEASDLDRRLEQVLEPLSEEDRARVKEALVKDAEQYVELLKPDIRETK